MTAQLAPLVTWTATHTRPGEVVASSGEPAIYLYTGRFAVPAAGFHTSDYFRPASMAESESALRDILSAYRVDAVVVVAADSLRAAVESMASRTPPLLAPA